MLDISLKVSLVPRVSLIRHRWRRHPSLCQMCSQVSAYDSVSAAGVYTSWRSYMGWVFLAWKVNVTILLFLCVLVTLSRAMGYIAPHQMYIKVLKQKKVFRYFLSTDCNLRSNYQYTYFSKNHRKTSCYVNLFHHLIKKSVIFESAIQKSWKKC